MIIAILLDLSFLGLADFLTSDTALGRVEAPVSWLFRVYAKDEVLCAVTMLGNVRGYDVAAGLVDAFPASFYKRLS